VNSVIQRGAQSADKLIYLFVRDYEWRAEREGVDHVPADDPPILQQTIQPCAKLARCVGSARGGSIRHELNGSDQTDPAHFADERVRCQFP